MNSKLTLLALAVSFLLPSAHAQLTFPFSNLHSVNPYSFNAARAGNYIGTKAFASYKSRFTSVDRAPSLLSFGLDNPIGASSGVGLRFFNDTRGIFETFHIDASGSYALQIAENQYLLMGLNAGIFNRQLDLSGASSNNISDPALNDEAFNETNFYGGAGLTYVFGGFELDVAAPKLFQQGTDLNTHMIAMASYEYTPPRSRISVRPSVLFELLPFSDNQYMANLMFNYDNTFWVQPSYRSNGSFLAATGFRFSYFELVYNLEIYRGDLAIIANSGHEVALYVSIPHQKTLKVSELLRRRPWLKKYKDDMRR